MPPVTEFYTKPKSIEDIVNHGVGKCLDQFDIEHNLYTRWGSPNSNCHKISFEKICTANRDKVYKIFATDYENYQKISPESFHHYELSTVRDNVAVVEEHMNLGDDEFVMMTKHVLDEPKLHEVFVIGGDAKGSHIQEKFKKSHKEQKF